MSLRIRRLAISNFRKFREPFAIEGLSDGLNIIIEPNETGKSTVLEALRAAFFVRHSTKNQLASSYAPYGENVAPEIEVGFDIAGEQWSVAKKLLKSPSIEVRGPTGRDQGEAAEERLQQLLGFERDSSRSRDLNTYGALGLLWVGQAEALEVSAPGRMVRDSVHATLEAEVGAIMGGGSYDRVRARVDQQYAELWTATGRPTGKQALAKERLETAEAASKIASERLAALEASFSELESDHSRLRVLDKELADDTETHARKNLVASTETARSAAQLLHTRRAEYQAVAGKARGLEELLQRHDAAKAALTVTSQKADKSRIARSEIAAEMALACDRANAAKAAHTEARTNYNAARVLLTGGEKQVEAARIAAASEAARQRHCKLISLEEGLASAKAVKAAGISVGDLTNLDELERAILKSRIELEAAATRIELVGSTEGITIQGKPLGVGEQILDGETRIELEGGATLIIRPPAASASTSARLVKSQAALADMLTKLGHSDVSVARNAHDASRQAEGEIKTLLTQIEALTQPDTLLDLRAGPEALKLLVAAMTNVPASGIIEHPDIAALKLAVEEMEITSARAEGAHDAAIEALRKLEEQDRPLAAAEVEAASDQRNATALVADIEAHADFAALTDALAEARGSAADYAVKLAEAEQNASAHDIAAIERKIAVIDARAAAANGTKRKLETDIARLEGTIESEGGKGLAQRAAAALEEAEAASLAYGRIREEAETIKLLRDTLELARLETSRTYVGPVAKRAKRHVERLLPGCELSYSEDLGLQSIIRGNIDEGCGNLSRGTQEQLGILTRLAVADMLLEQGRPVSLILDDPLVFSDDARLDLMTEILLDASKRMQVILLTCRDRAFRHVEGARLSLSPTSKSA
ncbi:AAA family ATPase [Novosphingobium sp. Leaf2]|uniref:AAA family ATPase n=1 Tax=Novosphingobium sp. Leaf2 TaxID=1735670 RepID=UPI0006FB8B7A|nr:AAA family ATPase [Novosphingobium sp. Leaf2]KQM20826.1 hypothetical protein ASE49_16145 [Novosphingobium sp. Leaf2]